MQRFLEKKLKSCVCLGGNKRNLGQGRRSKLSPVSQYGRAESLGNLLPAKLERCSGGHFNPIYIKKLTDGETIGEAPIAARLMDLDEMPLEQINEDGMLYINNGQEAEIPSRPSAQIHDYDPANFTFSKSIITLGELLAIPDRDWPFTDAEDSKTQELSITEPHAPSNSSDGEISSGKLTSEAVHTDLDGAIRGAILEFAYALDVLREFVLEDVLDGVSMSKWHVCPNFKDEGASMVATELEKMLMDDLIDEIICT